MRPIFSTRGVKSVIRFGDQIATLPNDFISDLKVREINSVVVAPSQPYRPSNTVELVGGPMDRFIAEIISAKENDRLQILINFMQRKVRANVKADQVMPLNLSE